MIKTKEKENKQFQNFYSSEKKTSEMFILPYIYIYAIMFLNLSMLNNRIHFEIALKTKANELNYLDTTLKQTWKIKILIN